MRPWLWIAILLLSVCACEGNGPPPNEPNPSSGEGAPPAALEDGSYSCDAYNSTRGNGPYVLDCDKSGDNVTIHFPNGGYLDLDIESQDSTDGSSWEIEATDAANGDSWTITVEK